MVFRLNRLFQNKKMKRLVIGFVVIFSIAIIFFLLRGPYLSNSIKRLIQPAMEDAIGEKIIIDKAVINLFPFYLQTNGLKVFDEEGNRLLWVTKMRAYVDVLGLFLRKIRIRRLTVREPNLTISRERLEKIIDSIKRYAEKSKDKDFSISLRVVKIRGGEFILTEKQKQIVVSGNGLYAGVMITPIKKSGLGFLSNWVKDTVDVELSVKETTLKLSNLAEMKTGFNGKIKLSDKKVKILGAKIYSPDSTLETKGEMQLSPEGVIEHGTFSGKANILIKTIAEIFGLREKKDGELSFSGSIDFVPGIKFDLKTKGWFYLQTLMELLKVRENITGRVSFDGEIHGIYPQITGRGMVRLKEVLLDTLLLNDINGELRYEDKKFSLNDFVAHTYDGELRGNASVLIPSGEYSVDAYAEGINSLQFFRFIKWQPPFPQGKINGGFRLTKKPGRKIELAAETTYLNTSNKGVFVNERLREIKADINMREDILTFNRAILSTSASELFLEGDIDLAEERLDLNLLMKSKDISDLTSPHFNGLRAPGRFKAKVVGHLNKPVVSGYLVIDGGTINGVAFTEIQVDLTYSPELLSVKLLEIKQEDSLYEVSGSITFRKATGLFSFESPYYKGNAVIKNGDAESLIAAVYPIRESSSKWVTGFINGRMSFEGDKEEFRGEGSITLKDGMVFTQPVDRVDIKALLSTEKIILSSIEASRDKSKLKANGAIYFDGRFNALIFSDNINMKDLTILSKYPVDANFSLDMIGSGTFKDPYVKFSIKISESYFKDFLIGKGDIKGELKNKRLSVRGNFLEGITTAEANVFFSDSLSWDVNIGFKKGRYDFLLGGFLKDVPKDLSASLEGSVKLKGKKNKFSIDSRFNLIDLSLYGYNFKNKGDIVLEFTEDTFKIKSLSVSGRDSDITATGVLKIGQGYNLTIKGKINLTPLKALIKTVELLKGDGNFAVEISGQWTSPELKGEINISNGAVMLTGLPYRIGSISGNIFLNKDRVTFDSFNADFAGGKIVASGVGYLEGLSLKRLFISSEIGGIRFRPIEDVDVALDGKLFFETSPKKQSLTGDINIKKAKYRKRVEWKSWLLPLKGMKEVSLRRSPFLGKTTLNVHITGQDNILIDNNIARTPVKIDLNAQGTLAQYGFIGRIEARGGMIFFRNNEFEIIDGSVDFVENNRIAPVFHILAETFTRGYRIRLNLDGPIKRFTLSLFSDPPLSEMDILSLLTTGHITKELKGLESGIGATEATAFLTGKLQDVMEERLKFITGFERFEVTPQTTSTGAVSPRVTVGKRLLGEKLFVTYSTSIGTREEHIIKLQYNLSKNFSIIGLRDEIGSVGGDVKFRFEFK